ncbi:MAG: DUF1080 domain-containing protein [Planctomycetaceae bacterium]
MPRVSCVFALGCCWIFTVSGCGPSPAPPAATASPSDDSAASEKPSEDASPAVPEPIPMKPAAPRWTALFDGQSLEGWEPSNFGGEGEVTVEEGAIEMEMGADLTGIHTDRELPKTNYEVALEARRVEGGDFFCGLTFPVGDDSCSLIVGGWGGGVCGLSSIDDRDASENDTTTYRGFETGQWYRVRLRVTGPRIQAWLDDERIVNQPLEGKKISIRQEVDPSRPFGVCSWRTTAALRDIRIRELSREEVERDAAEAKEES